MLHFSVIGTLALRLIELDWCVRRGSSPGLDALRYDGLVHTECQFWRCPWLKYFFGFGWNSVFNHHVPAYFALLVESGSAWKDDLFWGSNLSKCCLLLILSRKQKIAASLDALSTFDTGNFSQVRLHNS